MARVGSKRDKITEVASSYFATQGYSDTALENIASECEITKPAIYYHFKDKHRLYKEVLCSKFNLIVERILKDTNQDNPKEALKAYINTFGEYLIEDSNFGAIFARELADGARYLPNECIEKLAQTLNRLSDILQEGKKIGIFKEENPFMVQLMIVSTLTNYQTTVNLRKKVLKSLNRDIKEANPTIKDIIPNLSEKIIKALIC